MTASLSRRVKFAWLDAQRTPLPVTMSWTATDPLAVTLWFPTDGKTWQFPRSLMFDGLTTVNYAQVGDVRFIRDPHNTRVVLLEFSGLGSTGPCFAVFEVRRPILTAFLTAILTAESDAFLKEVTACD